MLVAVLNCCSKEELEESSDEEDIISPNVSTTSVPGAAIESLDEDVSADRRRAIKNKILAVGKMSRVFALLRCVMTIL
jgi:serine/threonine-protein phosphatase 2B catalytic subunit